VRDYAFALLAITSSLLGRMRVCVAHRLSKKGTLKAYEHSDPRCFFAQIIYALSEAFDECSLSMRENELPVTATTRKDAGDDVLEAVKDVTSSYLKSFSPRVNPIASTFMVHACYV
jgi:hypothetical protein